MTHDAARDGPRRVMVVGQPGAGKSTLARALGAGLALPVVHIDLIHWQAGWVERDRDDKLPLIRAAEDTEAWVIEGGLSATWDRRLDRADWLVWIDRPWPRRAWRVLRRSWRYRGRSRPDLPDGCPEAFGRQTLEFLGYIWRTRASGRARMADLAARGAAAGKRVVRLRSDRDARAWLAGLGIEAPAEWGRRGV